MTEQKPAIVIHKLGQRLHEVHNKLTGQVTHIWDWEKLQQEVNDACLAYESKQEKKASKTAKIDLVKETETKVKASRAKKVSTVAKKDK